jgi:alkanesulfonate monooxygenase SsuD/methylene tetrahydromethanopterin reductase-like flavin-dependent oxidoreductase (luciferase family)
MVALRTGAPLAPQRLVEDAEAAPVPEAHTSLLDGMRERWVIGAPKEAADRIRSLAEEFAVDEVMVNPVAGAFAGTAADAAPAREQTLELLAKELL